MLFSTAMLSRSVSKTSVRNPFRALLLGIAAVIALAVTLLSPAAAAPRPGLLLPPRVHAGDRIEIHWNAQLVNAVEVELVLSLDGGRTFNLHVSPELDPRTSAFVWHVPNLPAEGAILAVRSGSRNREEIWNTSAPFRILGDTAAPRGHVVLHEGSSWEVLEAPAAPGTRSFGGPQTSFEPAAGHASADLPPRSAAGVRAVRSARAGGNVLPRVASSARPNVAPFPRRAPLRN